MKTQGDVLQENIKKLNNRIINGEDLLLKSNILLIKLRKQRNRLVQQLENIQ
tara:strand:- start:12 stop:167 length:156 start_codon:yes stop_codon:yes gene_type:complete